MSKDLFQPVGPECANVECQILCYSFQSEPAMLISQGMAHHDRGQGKKWACSRWKRLRRSLWLTRKKFHLSSLIFCQISPTILIKGRRWATRREKEKEKWLHIFVADFQCKHGKQAHQGNLLGGNACFYWTQHKNFLLMEFLLNNRGKNVFTQAAFGSKYGFDKCFPKCHQHWSVKLLWKFQNSQKKPKCIFF